MTLNYLRGLDTDRLERLLQEKQRQLRLGVAGPACFARRTTRERLRDRERILRVLQES